MIFERPHICQSASRKSNQQGYLPFRSYSVKGGEVHTFLVLQIDLAAWLSRKN